MRSGCQFVGNTADQSFIIRDAADESEAVLRQRMLDIASIAVDGTSLVANAALEPVSCVSLDSADTKAHVNHLGLSSPRMPAA